MLPSGSVGAAAWLRGAALSQRAQVWERALPQGDVASSMTAGCAQAGSCLHTSVQAALWLPLQGSAMQHNETLSSTAARLLLVGGALVRQAEAMDKLAEKATTSLLAAMQHAQAAIL